MPRFDPVRTLGEGGAGRVSLVADRARGGERVALKELTEPSPEHVAALRREFALLASLKHPGLVEVLEFGVAEDGGAPRFTMEYVDGDDFIAAVARDGASALAPLVAEALRAIGFLHDFGVVHRDLKPGNILVRRAPKAGRRVVLLDFGLAAARRADAPTPAMAGTLPYLAPELFDGSAPSKRSDLYALGVVVFEAVHGRTPYGVKNDDVAGFVEAVRAGRRSRPSTPPGFPEGLGRWLDAMLSPDPAERPATATEALARLDECCGTELGLEDEDERAARLGSGAPPGREAEIEALRKAVAPAPHPRVVLLTGEPGSGKTRLLRFLEGEAIESGWTTITRPGALGDAADAQLAAIRTTAAAGPTIVLLDEIESADAVAVTLADRIAREPGEAPVVVVAALRPNEAGDPRVKKLLADVDVVPSLTRIDLAPLDEAGLTAMIERASAGRSSARARVGWLRETSEGNAGLAAALVIEGTWERKGRVPVAEALERSIRRRIDALDLEAQAWLEALVVLEGEAEESLVTELSGLEEGARPAADAAIAVGLARRAGTRVVPDSRRVADAVRRTMPAARARELHALAATHFATAERDVFGAAAWRLAKLWRGAGEPARALDAALDAARAAQTNKDHAEAAARFRFALTVLPHRDPRRSELWTQRGESLRHASLHAPSIRAFGWAARHARDEATRLVAKARQARSVLMVGAYVTAAERAKRVCTLAVAEGVPLAEAIALYVLAGVANSRLEIPKSREYAMGALAKLRDIDAELRVQLLVLVVVADGRLGLPSLAEHEAELFQLCELHQFTYQSVMALLSRSRLSEFRGQLLSSWRYLESAEQIARRSGEANLVRKVVHEQARCAFALGRFDASYSLFLSAAELSRFEGDDERMLSAIEGAVTSLERLGRESEATKLLEEGIRRSRLSTDNLWRVYVSITLARLLSRDSHADRDIAAAIMNAAAPHLRGSAPSVRLDWELAEFHRRQSLPPRGEDEGAFRALELALQECGQQVPFQLVERVRVDCARWLVSRRRFLDALSYVGEPFKFMSEADPLRRAEAQFALADAMAGLSRHDEARLARLAGKALIDEAASLISDPDMRRDLLEQPLVRDLLATIPRPADSRRLEALYEMIRGLNSEEDPEALLGSILEMATRATGAERGMILLAGPSGADFSVRLAKNLEKETEADAEGFSRRIMAEAGAGRSILAIDAGDDDRYRDLKSVSLFRIRSLMCVPLRSRGVIIGTVYLDSRKAGTPFTNDDLRFVEAFADHAAIALSNARRRAELEAENKRLRAAVGERSRYEQIVGRSTSMQRVFDLLEKLEPSDVTVLIQGESGTGKELVARALHSKGPRRDRPFLSENCAALPETLLESELFGHVRGAFTGADKDRTGLFEQAHGGTLFLDEIGDTSAALQARLLRVVQEGELRRVGDERPIKVDVRLIAASNKDLQAEVAGGRFREDLYYRLAVLPITLPPLRERVGDVPFLVQHLLERHAGARGRKVPKVDAEVLDAFERYPWPGNVRQLENVLRRLVVLSGDAGISRSVIESDSELSRTLLGKPEAFAPVMSLTRSEEEQIRRALEASAGNRDRAARLLGISRATIYRKMKEYQLS